MLFPNVFQIKNGYMYTTHSAETGRIYYVADDKPLVFETDYSPNVSQVGNKLFYLHDFELERVNVIDITTQEDKVYPLLDKGPFFSVFELNEDTGIALARGSLGKFMVFDVNTEEHQEYELFSEEQREILKKDKKDEESIEILDIFVNRVDDNKLVVIYSVIQYYFSSDKNPDTYYYSRIYEIEE